MQSTELLTDREKFIAHYLSVLVVGIMSNQSDDVIDKTVTKLRESRSRNLSEEEAIQIIRLLNEEFLLSGCLLSTLNRALRDGHAEEL